MMLLASCYEIFEPDIDSVPVLCLNSRIAVGQPIHVSVSHTWSYADQSLDPNHEVADAVVQIYVNGILAEDDYLPKEGDLIRIVAESPTYGDAEAEVFVPSATPIEADKIAPTIREIRYYESDAQDGDMIADISFDLSIEMTITDLDLQNNYFMFAWQSFNQEEISDDADDPAEAFGWSIGSFEYNSEPIFKEHIGEFETVIGSDDIPFTYFTDRQFAGSHYTLHLKFTDCVYIINMDDYDENLLDCGVILYLKAISESYYNMVLYRWNADHGIIGDLSDIGLAESKWGYSNVSSGAGVVTAENVSYLRINLKEFLNSELLKIPKGTRSKHNIINTTK